MLGNFMKILSRRQLLVGGALTMAGASLYAQTYPERTVRILVGYSPGGPTFHGAGLQA